MSLLTYDVESLISERPLCLGTQNQYRRAVRCYSEFLGTMATREHLDEPPVNRWLQGLEQRRSPETVRGRKAGITALWNWLAEIGEVRHYNPNRLRRIRVIRKPPIAWSVENVRALLRGAASVNGELRCGLSASQMLTAWVWLGYESGIRPSDILRLDANQISGCVTIIQHKTGKPHTFRLSPAALDAIGPLIANRVKVFGLPRSTARRWELKLFRAAEAYGFHRFRGQGLGTLRKSHGTEVARRGGLEAAAQSLGHVSGTRVARDSYVQPDAILHPPAPPSLNDDGARRPARHIAYPGGPSRRHSA